MPVISVGLSIRPELGSTAVGARAPVSEIAAFATVAEDAGLAAFLLDDTAARDRSIGPFALLGYLAAKTERIVLGVISPAISIRPPSIVAKMVAGLGVVSHGRAIVALAPSDADGHSDARADGWNAEDLEAAEVVCRSLRDPAPSYEGRYFVLHDAWNEPRSGPGSTPIYRVVRGGLTSFDADRFELVRFPLVPDPTEDEVQRIAIVSVGPKDAPLAVAERIGERRSSGSTAVVLQWSGPLDAARLREVAAAAAEP